MSKFLEVKVELERLFEKYRFDGVEIDWTAEKGGEDKVTPKSILVNVSATSGKMNSEVHARILFAEFVFAFHAEAVANMDSIGRFRATGLVIGWLGTEDRASRRHRTITKVKRV